MRRFQTLLTNMQNNLQRNSILKFITTCGADNQFSSPKQIRWSAVLGKLLVGNSATITAHIRNADLSFFSKFYYSASVYLAIDSDTSDIYIASSGVLRKLSYNYNIVAQLLMNSARMIDASGDPDYVYVTSNNATDHHGLRQVKKSTMAVTASLLADGAGDGQFDDPLGLFYYNSEIFVADYDNSRIQVIAKTGESLAYNRQYALGYKPLDLCFDGTNWYVVSATAIYKYDNVFTDATKTSMAVGSGYSITYIPDQGDGYGATLAITDSTNSHLARYRSDLTLINEVGSSGDGSASLFDPIITGCAGNWFMDDGSTFAVASGANISWNGFSGYTWKTDGPHRAIFRPSAGLAAVTGIDFNTDSVTKISNLKKCSITSISSWPSTCIINIIDLPLCTIWDTGYSVIYGNLSSINRSAVTIYFNNNSGSLVGSIASLPLTSERVKLYGLPGITAGSIGHVVGLRDIRIYSMGWLTADVDLVIDSAYQARMSYTYATGIAMNIGGTNQNPSGTDPMTDPTVTPGNGNSNSDWQWDAGLGHHVPLTGLAKVFVLANDPFGEGFNTWVITY